MMMVVIANAEETINADVPLVKPLKRRQHELRVFTSPSALVGWVVAACKEVPGHALHVVSVRCDAHRLQFICPFQS